MKPYTGLSIHNDTNRQLQRLADQQGISKAAFIALMVEYFRITKRNPADIDSKTLEQKLGSLDATVRRVLKLVKFQDSKFLAPLAESVYGMEQSLGAFSNVSGLLPQLLSSVTCPKCGASLTSFTNHNNSMTCGHCNFSVPLKVGQYALTITDMVTLFTGGMTRYFEDISSNRGERKSGRLFLTDTTHALHIATTDAH